MVRQATPENPLTAEERLQFAFNTARSNGHEVGQTYLDPRTESFDSIAFTAAEAIVLQGVNNRAHLSLYNKWDFQEKAKDNVLDSTIRRVTAIVR